MDPSVPSSGAQAGLLTRAFLWEGQGRRAELLAGGSGDESER